MKPDADTEHLDHVEHREEEVVQRSSQAGNAQVHGNGEADRGYPNGDRGDDTLGARALWVQLHDRPGQRLLLESEAVVGLIVSIIMVLFLRVVANWRHLC